MTLEAQLEEAELKALESAYRLGIAMEENKTYCDALREIRGYTDPPQSYESLNDIRDAVDTALRVNPKQPDITITCITQQDLNDITKFMNFLIPMKYKFIGHVFKDGTHILTYRRA